MRKTKLIKKHLIEPDLKFDSLIISQLINKVMKDGNKRKAIKIVYQAAEIIEKLFSEKIEEKSKGKGQKQIIEEKDKSSNKKKNFSKQKEIIQKEAMANPSFTSFSNT